MTSARKSVRYPTHTARALKEEGKNYYEGLQHGELFCLVHTHKAVCWCAAYTIICKISPRNQARRIDFGNDCEVGSDNVTGKRDFFAVFQGSISIFATADCFLITCLRASWSIVL